MTGQIKVFSDHLLTPNLIKNENTIDMCDIHFNWNVIGINWRGRLYINDTISGLYFENRSTHFQRLLDVYRGDEQSWLGELNLLVRIWLISGS